MSKQVQFRRGTTSEHAAFTGAVGEITVNTTTHQLVSHDGVTAGGFPQAVAVGTTTDNAAMRANGTAGAMQNSALLIADTTGDLSRSGGGGIDIQGTSTNDGPPTGYIGELVESEVSLGSAVSLTSSTATNVTSISLTAGHWHVWGNVGLNPSAAVMTAAIAGINTVSATQPTMPGKGGYTRIILSSGSWTANQHVLPIAGIDLKLSSTTTVYLIALGTFVSGTNSAFGYIGARRIR